MAAGRVCAGTAWHWPVGRSILPAGPRSRVCISIAAVDGTSRRSTDRPLVIALGSSRTEMGLRSGRLSQSAEKGGPLVFNFAIPGSGPMMQQVALHRLLAGGVRPDLVLLEATPLSLSRRGGAPLEERLLDPARLDSGEAIQLHRYYHQPYKLWTRWLAARILPSYRHQSRAARSPCPGCRSDREGARGHR